MSFLERIKNWVEINHSKLGYATRISLGILVGASVAITAAGFVVSVPAIFYMGAVAITGLSLSGAAILIGYYAIGALEDWANALNVAEYFPVCTIGQKDDGFIPNYHLTKIAQMMTDGLIKDNQESDKKTDQKLIEIDKSFTPSPLLKDSGKKKDMPILSR